QGRLQNRHNHTTNVMFLRKSPVVIQRRLEVEPSILLARILVYIEIEKLGTCCFINRVDTIFPRPIVSRKYFVEKWPIRPNYIKPRNSIRIKHGSEHQSLGQKRKVLV